MSHKKDIQIGEKVWIEPVSVPVPYEARLRGGVLSGQRGHPVYPPDKNQHLSSHRVPKVTGPVEVVWSEWWRRRFNQKEIKLSSPPVPVGTEPKADKPKAGKKAGGDK